MGKRILLVEDNPQNLYLATFLLENSGHEVIQATDGEDAVARSVEPVDLVLLDMRLPKMNGDVAAPLIRKTQPHPAPIVAVTAYSMSGDLEWILSYCDGCITKPIDPDTFVDQVEEYLK